VSKKAKEKFYPCVYYPDSPCPVKEVYKLKPESLVLFCAYCPFRNKPRKKNS